MADIKPIRAVGEGKQIMAVPGTNWTTFALSMSASGFDRSQRFRSAQPMEG